MLSSNSELSLKFPNTGIINHLFNPFSPFSIEEKKLKLSVEY